MQINFLFLKMFNYRWINMNKILITVFLAGFILLMSCTEEKAVNNTKSGMYFSQVTSIGNGTAKAFVNLDASGNPESVGVIFNSGVLTGLPDEMKEYLFMMPQEASATNINHVSIDWGPQGHEPEGVYTLPHFDFHFYLVDMNFRLGMTGVGDDTLKMTKQPGADYLAPNYVLGPAGVPMMGNHAVDVTSPELNGATFTETFIYGYYDGSMIFYEPMITVDYLMTKPSLNKTLKVPLKYPKTGYYPTTYSISYNEDSDEYTVKLGGMVKYSE
jgi:hypothetical protein